LTVKNLIKMGGFVGSGDISTCAEATPPLTLAIDKLSLCVTFVANKSISERMP
jgi:hypothetical protein